MYPSSSTRLLDLFLFSLFFLFSKLSFFFLSLILFFFRSTLHWELPKPIETQKPKLLAFIDSASGLACFPRSPIAHTWMKIFPPHPNRLPCSDGKRNRWNKIYVSEDSVWRMNKCDKKSSVRSFTNTATPKLFIGPTRWLVLLIELGTVRVLVLATTVTSVGRAKAPSPLVVVATLASDWRCFSLFGRRSWKFHQRFSLMKNRKRRRRGGMKQVESDSGIINEAHELSIYAYSNRALALWRTSRNFPRLPLAKQLVAYGKAKVSIPFM